MLAYRSQPRQEWLRTGYRLLTQQEHNNYGQFLTLQHLALSVEIRKRLCDSTKSGGCSSPRYGDRLVIREEQSRQVFCQHKAEATSAL